jgi:hypothetical protein
VCACARYTAPELASVMSALSGLRRLELVTCACTVAGLTRLVIHETCLCDAGAIALACGLLTTTGLVEVRISNQRLSSAGVRALCPTLRRHSGLQVLHMAALGKPGSNALNGFVLANFGPALAS